VGNARSRNKLSGQLLVGARLLSLSSVSDLSALVVLFCGVSTLTTDPFAASHPLVQNAPVFRGGTVVGRRHAIQYGGCAGDLLSCPGAAALLTACEGATRTCEMDSMEGFEDGLPEDDAARQSSRLYEREGDVYAGSF